MQNINRKTKNLKKISIFFGIILTTHSFATTNNNMINAYNFSFDSLISQNSIGLSTYQNKVLLVVNTASKCGFTPQYEGLEKLYQDYKDKGLVVIGVPSNDFANQEPSNNEQIASFCSLNYGVSFPMAAKYSVTGNDAHPFYKWAKKELGFLTAPKWNFHKYLISRDGKLIDYFYSSTNPQSKKVIRAVELALESPIKIQ